MITLIPSTDSPSNVGKSIFGTGMDFDRAGLRSSSHLTNNYSRPRPQQLMSRSRSTGSMTAASGNWKILFDRPLFGQDFCLLQHSLCGLLLLVWRIAVLAQ